jgi:hypothetical protein
MGKCTAGCLDALFEQDPSQWMASGYNDFSKLHVCSGINPQDANTSCLKMQDANS